MSWVRVDSSVPRNPKFLRAGASASWLWLCGLAYCQQGLTDGFIPIEALHTLGVLSKEHPEKLAERLVQARLWNVSSHPEPVGWWVHGYLNHNRSADQVANIKAEKQAAGKRGGEASGRSRVLKQSAEALDQNMVKHSANPSTSTATDQKKHTRAERARVGSRPDYTIWECPHEERCSDRGVCHQSTILCRPERQRESA